MAKKVDLTQPGGADQIASIMRGNISKVMRAATTEFYRQVTIATPVDTGRARHGWEITTDTPSDIVPPEGKYPPPKIQEHGEQNIINVDPQETIYITNRVPYIEKLNKGSSRQQPARFVELAAARVQQGLQKLISKEKGQK